MDSISNTISRIARQEPMLLQASQQHQNCESMRAVKSTPYAKSSSHSTGSVDNRRQAPQIAIAAKDQETLRYPMVRGRTHSISRDAEDRNSIRNNGSVVGNAYRESK